MRFKTDQFFPTQVMSFDYSEYFTDSDMLEVEKYVDYSIKNEYELQIDDRTPKYQSLPRLFNEGKPSVFRKIRGTFHEACMVYLQQVPNFVSNQEAIRFTHSTAWFYSGWKSLNEKETNPWHQHNPALLVGVFYVKVPGNPADMGTEFHDPRGPWTHTSQMQCISAIEKGWVIFPGWLYHKSMPNTFNEENRIVIAANAYAAVL